MKSDCIRNEIVLSFKNYMSLLTSIWKSNIINRNSVERGEEG